MEIVKIKEPFNKDLFKNLTVGNLIYLSGTIYTMRDQAHKMLFQKIDKGEKLPFDVKNSIIYYTGPSPTRSNEIVGSFGPTTSSRMDSFTPKLYDMGVIATIGKGDRSQEVINSIIKNNAIYLLAIGGTGALLSKKVKSIKVIEFEFLGTESIKKVVVEDFPCYVAIDSKGNSIEKLWNK